MELLVCWEVGSEERSGGGGGRGWSAEIRRGAFVFGAVW